MYIYHNILFIYFTFGNKFNMKIIKIAFALALINILSSCYHDVVPHIHRAGDTYLVYSVKEITKSTAASLPVGSRVCIYCDSKNFPDHRAHKSNLEGKIETPGGDKYIIELSADAVLCADCPAGVTPKFELK